MPFRAKLRGALAHDLDELAARILRRQAFAADATMPSYEGQLEEATARRLAA